VPTVVRVSVVVIFAACAALTLTPMGVWLVRLALSSAAEEAGWMLTVGEHGGALATGVHLRDVNLRHAEHGLEIDISEVTLEPWSWSVVLQRPNVRWIPLTDSVVADAPAPPSALELRLENLPVLDVVAGSFLLDADSLLLEVTDVTASLSAEGDEAQLHLACKHWSLTRGTTEFSGEGRSRWRLHSGAVDLQDLFLRTKTEGSNTEGAQATLRGQGQLALVPPFQVSSKLMLAGETTAVEQLWLDLSTDGTLAPLDLRVTTKGGGKQPILGPFSVQAAAYIDSQSIRADSVQIEVAGGRVHGHVSWQTGLDITADLDGIETGVITKDALRGGVQGRVVVSGAIDNLQIETNLQADAISGIAAEPVDLALSATVEDGQLVATVVSDQLGTLDASGNLELTQGSHDLNLSGELNAAPWLGRDWSLSVQGDLRNDSLDISMQAPRLPYGEDPPGPVQIDASLVGWQHLDVRIGLDRGRIEAQAKIDLATAHLDTLRGSTRGLSLQKLAGNLGGRLDSRWDVGGDLGSPAGVLSLQVDDLAMQGWSLGPTTVKASIAEGAICIDGQATGLDLHATIDTSSAQVTAQLADALLHRRSSKDSLQFTGKVDTAVPLYDWEQGEMHAQIVAASARLAGWKLELQSGTQVDFVDGHLRLHPTELTTPLGTLRMNGDLAQDSLDFVAVIDTIEIGSPEIDSPKEMTGAGQVRLQVGGSLQDPRARLDLALTSLAMGDRPLGELTAFLDLSDSLRGALITGYPDNDVSGLVAQLSAPSADFQPLGKPTGQEQARVRIVAEDLDASIFATYALGDSTNLTASMSADLLLPARDLLGTIDWRDVSGVLALQGLVVERNRVRMRLAAPSQAQLDEGRVALEGFDLPVEVFQRDTDAFEAAGSVHINGKLAGDGGRLSIRTEGLELLAVKRVLPGRPYMPDGVLALQANLTGTFEDPALDVNGEIELDLLGYLSARVFGRPRAWNASATWVTPVEDSLRVTVSAPAVNIWPKWDEMTMRAHSRGIDLLPLLDQVPQLENLAGTVRLDVTADSLSTNPRFVGQIEVEDLELVLLDVKPGYSFANGRIEFEAREGNVAHAELLGFQGKTTRGKGQLELTGFFDVLPGGDTDYRIQLQAQDIRYEYDDVFDAPDIDIDMALVRDEEGPLLEGRVKLNNPQADVQLVDLTAPPVPPPPTLQNEFLENTRLNLYIEVDGLETRSELSRITLAGQTRVYGTFYQPRFQGELEVEEGEVIILNRPFTFSRGRVILDRLVPTYSILDLMHDPILLDPELDLEATATVQPNDPNEPEVEVTMTLKGPVRTAAPRLSSGSLGDTEVLTLLAFGSVSAKKEYASALYAAAGQLLLSRRVQRVGLDEFLLLPSGTALGTVGASAVRVGKFLSWPVPVWVRYEANTLEISRGQFEVEYRITPWMTIDASAYSEYQLYGLGVGLSREF
jgi:hypothetical protein